MNLEKLGMILFNLSLFRKYNIFNRFIEFIIDTSKFYVLDDQDAYNLFFKGYIKLIAIWNNFIVNSLSYTDFSIENINIIHYCGYSNPKPWIIQQKLPINQLQLVQIYRQYAKLVVSKFNSNPKIAFFITVSSSLDQAIHKLEMILIPNSCNFDVFLFCTDKMLIKDLKDYYGGNLPVDLFEEELNFEKVVSVLEFTEYKYYYFLFGDNRLDNSKDFKELTKYAEDTNASLVAPSYAIYRENKYYFL